MFLSSRQAGYSNRQQMPSSCKGLQKKATEVSGRYCVVGSQMAGCRHILTGLHVFILVNIVIFKRHSQILQLFIVHWNLDVVVPGLSFLVISMTHSYLGNRTI